MSNCYKKVTARNYLLATKYDYKKLKRSFEEDEGSGFDCEFHEKNKAIYIYANEFGDEDSISRKSLSIISDLLKRNKEDFLEFGYAYYDDKAKMDSAGGGVFRITQKGLEFPEVAWRK